MKKKYKPGEYPAFAILSLCFWAGAISPVNAEIFTKETLPVKPAKFNRALDATFKLELANVGGLCTAVAISEDGYVLTNLHCLMPCLVENNLVEKSYFNPLMGRETKAGVISIDEGEYHRIRRVREQAPSGIPCEKYMLSLGNEYFDGNWHNSEQFFYGAKIVWLGRSTSVFSDEDVSRLTDKVVGELRNSQDDFAILKFNLPHPVACMPVAHMDAKSGDSVWSVGYPMFASRDSGLNSPGSRKAVSFGKVRGTIAEDPYLRNLVDNPDPQTGEPAPKLNLTVADWLLLEKIYENPDTLLTDLDAMPGNSGSMIINKDGKMVALLHGGVAYAANKYLGATVQGLRINVILDEVLAGLGREKYDKIFSCPVE